ncbi:MAG: hypothetical protein RIS82_706 [Actinomycetota bacterium]
MKPLARISAALLSLAVALIATGCAQLPTSGAIKTGPDIQSSLENDYLYYSPQGPELQASQEEILLGFLNAGTGPQNDYSIAREFLSEDFKSIWKPSSGVLIRQGSPEIVATTDQTARVDIRLSAQVNGQGQYSIATEGATESLYFSFVKEGNEWRISSAPNLTTVIRPVFDVIFQSYALYFFDNQLNYLVPDLRWFPSRASTSTRLIDALLKGPSAWLDPAVTSAIPAGTKLSLSSVNVTGGQAVVDLSSRALSTTYREKQLMEAQIRETLLQLNSVFTVRLQIERAPQDIVDIDAFTPTSLSSSPVAFLESGLSYVDVSSSTKIVGTNGVLDQLGATEFSLSSDERTMLVRGSAGIYLSSFGTLGSKAKLLAEGTGYVSPVIDRQGFSWVSGTAPGSVLKIYGQAGQPLPILANWLIPLSKYEISISEEGARALIVAGTGSDRKIFVSAIVRDENGRPIELAEPIQPVNSKLPVISASWVNATSIGYLEAAGESYTSASVQTLGGVSTTLPRIEAGAKVVGNSSAGSIFILNSRGELYQQRGVGWTLLRGQVTAVHFPAT